MNKIFGIASLGVAALALTSCGSHPVANNPSSATQSAAQAPASSAFEKPTIPTASAFLPPVAVKGMIQTTNSQARLSQISASGRRDPFSAILPASIQLPSQKTSQAAVSPSQAPAKQTANPTSGAGDSFSSAATA